MKIRILAYLTVGTVLLMSSCQKKEIDNLQGQIDALKADKIASVEEQAANIEKSIIELQTTEEYMKAFVAAAEERVAELSSHTEGREADIDKLSACVDSLKVVDAEILEQVDLLRKYVDTQIGQYEDWASATFGTLEKYDSLCNVVAAISALSNYAQTFFQNGGAAVQCAEDLAEAADKSLESMKVWVNEKFSNYYTIAEVEAAINVEFFNSDSAAASAIAEQYAAIEDAKFELTKGYKRLILESVTNLEGRISGDIDTVINDLNERIDAIVAAIPGLEARLKEVEKKIESLMERVQSIALVSGKSGLAYIGRNISCLDFEITPVSVAPQLVDLFEDYDDLFTLSVFPTATKAVDPIILHATAAVMKGDTLSLTFNTSYLDEKFYSDTPEVFYNACLNINSEDSTIGISSKYFRVSYMPGWKQDWFCIIPESNNTYISFEEVGDTPDVTFEYSTDGETWTPFSAGTLLPDNLKPNTSIFIRNTASSVVMASDSLNYNRFVINGPVKLSGDITYLLDKNSALTEFDPNQKYAFARLFENCEITDAKNLVLPCEVLSEGCYLGMFKNCTSLTDAPSLRADVLEKDSYREMFCGCSSLSSIKCTATDISAEDCTTDWVKNVAPTGTIIVDSSAQFEEESDSGCPKGWTISYLLKKLFGKWVWAEDGNGVWGNAGHTGNGSGFTVTDIDGKWWGQNYSKDLIGRDEPADDIENANKDAATGSYMIFDDDGNVTSYTIKGSKIRGAQWEVKDFDAGRHNGWELAKLKTTSPVILFPYPINKKGKTVPEFDIMYIDDKNISLVYTNGQVASSWGEITWWRFKKVQ